MDNRILSGMPENQAIEGLIARFGPLKYIYAELRPESILQADEIHAIKHGGGQVEVEDKIITLLREHDNWLQSELKNKILDEYAVSDATFYNAVGSLKNRGVCRTIEVPGLKSKKIELTDSYKAKIA